MSSKKVLIVTYYWPPSGGVGVQRWMNFSLQLKKRGWEPIIYTPKNPQFEISDERQLEKVKDIRVVKNSIWEPFELFHRFTGQRERKNVKQGLVLEKSKKTFKDRLAVWVRGNVFVPDPRVFWVDRSVKFLTRFMASEGIEILITTGPPHSMHLIGKGLKKKLAFKWIADFRDPWSRWDVLKKLNTSVLAMALHERLEKQVVKSADIVTTVSKRLGKAFETDYPRPVKILHNGVSINRREKSKRTGQSFVIGYFGMLNELRNPSRLWQVLDQLCREDNAFEAALKIKIGGIVSENIQQELTSLKRLADKVEFLGYLPRHQVVDVYSQCDLLLLLLNKSDNAKWILPVKFFEYLSANRKILALGERDSDLGDLMNNKDVGELLDYSSVGEIRAFVKHEFENREEPNSDHVSDLIKKFSHEELADELEKILTE